MKEEGSLRKNLKSAIFDRFNPSASKIWRKKNKESSLALRDYKCDIVVTPPSDESQNDLYENSPFIKRSKISCRKATKNKSKNVKRTCRQNCQRKILLKKQNLEKSGCNIKPENCAKKQFHPKKNDKKERKINRTDKNTSFIKTKTSEDKDISRVSNKSKTREKQSKAIDKTKSTTLKFKLMPKMSTSYPSESSFTYSRRGSDSQSQLLTISPLCSPTDVQSPIVIDSSSKNYFSDKIPAKLEETYATKLTDQSEKSNPTNLIKVRNLIPDSKIAIKLTNKTRKVTFEDKKNDKDNNAKFDHFKSKNDDFHVKEILTNSDRSISNTKCESNWNLKVSHIYDTESSTNNDEKITPNIFKDNEKEDKSKYSSKNSNSETFNLKLEDTPKQVICKTQKTENKKVQINSKSFNSKQENVTINDQTRYNSDNKFQLKTEGINDIKEVLKDETSKLVRTLCPPPGSKDSISTNSVKLNKDTSNKDDENHKPTKLKNVKTSDKSTFVITKKRLASIKEVNKIHNQEHKTKIPDVTNGKEISQNKNCQRQSSKNQTCFEHLDNSDVKVHDVKPSYLEKSTSAFTNLCISANKSTITEKQYFTKDNESQLKASSLNKAEGTESKPNISETNIVSSKELDSSVSESTCTSDNKQTNTTPTISQTIFTIANKMNHFKSN